MNKLLNKVILEDAEVNDIDHNTIEVKRGEDTFTYRKRLRHFDVSFDILVNGTIWFGNQSVDDEFKLFWTDATDVAFHQKDLELQKRRKEIERIVGSLDFA